MKLFLSGGGSRAFNLDKKFIDSIDKSKPLMYIPIAMDAKRHPYPECLEWVKGYFSKLGFDNIEMVSDLRKFNKKDLNKFGGVYIGGGNTPYLLKEIKESGFWDYLNYFMEKDIPIGGGSAGAIIFAKTIIPSLSADENKVKLKDFTSFNKIKDYELWAHYTPSMDNEIKEYMKKYNLEKIIALPEYTGVYVKDNKIEVFGEKPVFLFNKKGKQEIQSGKQIK